MDFHPIIYPETNSPENEKKEDDIFNNKKDIITPQTITPETSILKKEKEEESEQTEFFITKDDDLYILTCFKIKNESLLLQLKLNSISSNIYYEANYTNNNLVKISNLFTLCQDIEESYNVLIDNLNKNEDNLKIDFINENSVKLFFFVELPTKKKENTHIILNKKKSKSNKSYLDDNYMLFQLNDLNSKIDVIQEKHNELEKKVEEKFKIITNIIDKQNYLEKELKNKIKEIEEIKLFQSKYENISKNNENKIDTIEKEQKNIMDDIDNFKKEELKLNNKKIEKILNDYPQMEEKIQKILKTQDEIQKILNNNDNEIDSLTERLLKSQNSLDQVNLDIKTIKENQTKIKEEINKKQEEVEKNKINENEEKDNTEEIIKQIEELKKENEIMKEKINNNEKKLISFTKKIEKKFEIEDEKINHIDFKFAKNISSDLFNVNFYNNRACIFTSYQDDNIYVAYGIVLSLNLECYDVINDKKFIIIKKLHKDSFDSCRYFYDDIQKKDLIITSSLDSHVKVVNFKKDKSEIILDLNFESTKDAIINTAYFYQEFIMVPFSKERTVKFYTMSSDFIGELEEDAGFILGLSKYHCKRNDKHYALIANTEGIFVFCIDGFCLYNKFIPPKKTEEEKKENGFDEAYIIEKDEKLILIGPCFYYGYIYLWDFINGNLVYTFETSSGVSDICLWDNKYIFSSLTKSVHEFLLINLDSKKIVKKFFKRGKEDFGAGVKVLRHKSKGDFLISISIKGNLDLYKINK